MNLHNSLIKQTLPVLWAGLVKTLVCILVYRLLVEQLDEALRYKLFTLILIITPLFLYLTLKKMVVSNWDCKLPFGKTMLTGILFTLGAGTGIAILDYLVLVFKIPGFAEPSAATFNKPFLAFMFVYLSWYGMIGLAATPVVYFILKWQIKKK